jgi:uncharacterized protein YndB with AHSA1/START domain
MRWASTRTIAAPPDRVFAVVGDPDEFQKAVGGPPVEYLGSRRKFRATRIHKGKATAFDQEVTELVPGERVRLLNITHGTPWDSTFAVVADGHGSVLTLTMDAFPPNFFGRLMMHLIRRMVQKALEKDMDAIRAYCESGT